MNLIISNPENIDLDDFCEWLIPQIQRYLIASIDDNHLIRWDYYLNLGSTFLKTYRFDRPVSSKEILIAGSYNLIVKKQPEQYTIELNMNTIIPNSSAKFINVISLINNGNLSMQGYNIYTQVMDYIANNIDYYFKAYTQNREE